MFIYLQCYSSLLYLPRHISMTVYSCHVTYAFQNEATLYSCLNVKELLTRSRRQIWRLSDCNWTRTQNHLVRKRTLNHLAKLESSCSQLTLIFRACFEQEVAWYSGNYRVWIHSERRTWHEKNIQSPYKCTVQIRIQNTAQSFGQFGQMVECSFTN